LAALKVKWPILWYSRPCNCTQKEIYRSRHVLYTWKDRIEARRHLCEILCHRIQGHCKDIRVPFRKLSLWTFLKSYNPYCYKFYVSVSTLVIVKHNSIYIVLPMRYFFENMPTLNCNSTANSFYAFPYCLRVLY
jgi:hypothetical protein